MDIHRLIAEIRRKPGLWNLHCTQYKDRILIATLWNQVARSVNADVDMCKHKWRNLRDAYRAEIRRIERRMSRDSILGIPFNKKNYKSKWAYFNEMDFMRSYKRRSSVGDKYDDSANSNGDDYDRPDNDSDDTKFHTSIDIKMEPQDDNMTDEFHNISNHFQHPELIINDDDMSSDMMFEGFESVEGSDDNVEEESSLKNSKEANLFSKDNSNVKQEFESNQKLSGILNSIEKPKKLSLKENSNLLATNKNDCKCLKRSEQHVQFQEDDLCKKKPRLMAITKKQATDACNLQHIGDSDYNFLISFLPQIKKMTALQNLHFRAKLSVVVLNTLAP